MFLNHTSSVTVLDSHILLNQVFWISRSMKAFFHSSVVLHKKVISF